MIDQTMVETGTNGHIIRYLEFTIWAKSLIIGDTVDAMPKGTCTFPAYAYQTGGGIVCTAIYAVVPHPAFAQPFPAVDLMDYCDSQTVHSLEKSNRESERWLVELMQLDAWMSIVGRTPQIRGGYMRLLVQTSALVQNTMTFFRWAFFDSDLWSESADRVSFTDVYAGLSTYNFIYSFDYNDSPGR
jgi:hypothetical protein